MLSNLSPARRTSLPKLLPKKKICMGPRAHLSSKKMYRQLVTAKKVTVALLRLISLTLRMLARRRPRPCSRLREI
jgi:hypothetical protein